MDFSLGRLKVEPVYPPTPPDSQKGLEGMKTKTATLVRTLTAFALIGVFSAACAVTDYVGYRGHATDFEAKMMGVEYAFSGFGAESDGTYSYTVAYDWTDVNAPSEILIRAYRNPVSGAFSNDGAVTQDGDVVRFQAGDLSLDHSPAIPAGRYDRQWKYIDNAPGCQFSDNFVATDENNPITPVVSICYNAPVQEGDRKNRSLQDSWASIDALANHVMAVEPGTPLTLEMTSIELNGTVVALDNSAEIFAVAQGTRLGGLMLDGSTPGGQDLIKAILDTTEDGLPADIKVTFTGGMEFSLPSNMTVAFHHDRLFESLQ